MVLELEAITFLKAWKYAASEETYDDYLVRDFLRYLITRAGASAYLPGTTNSLSYGQAWVSKTKTALEHAERACEREAEDNDLMACFTWRKSLESNSATDVQLQVIRESFGRVLYTHKTHEKDRERLTFLGTASKWTNIFLSGLTFGGVIATVGTKDPFWLGASLVLSTLSAGYAVFQLSFDPNKKAGGHRAAAKQFLVIRNQYVHLMADIVEGIMTPDEIRTRRDELEKETADAFAVAPDTSNKAYRMAQKALKVDEDMTFGDEELNMFLPAALAYAKPLSKNQH